MNALTGGMKYEEKYHAPTFNYEGGQRISIQQPLPGGFDGVARR